MKIHELSVKGPITNTDYQSIRTKYMITSSDRGTVVGAEVVFEFVE